MDRRHFLLAAGIVAAGLAAPRAGVAAQGATLPPPALPGDKSLEAALRARQTQRSFETRPLPGEILSGLLWAANGVNRPEVGKHTAPTAMNRQEIDVYVAKADGLFRYEPKEHRLERLSTEDLRAATGKQAFAATVPVDLVYVADMGKVAGATPEEKAFYAGADTGFVSQNVYLYCAAMGLATVVRASFDGAALAKAMGLPDGRRITLAQSVGYPKA
ncbi:SagB/ThcOx family dehydrogenase [Solidesulfovibrio sp.]|uniref:SagB/ThcOx family dehydrogenase n=1 Tax=Solidesulfovibrio sp. TaxID=2910990 RepID=UPI002B1EE921|nr:SagB/ThcOx family dehydrogenase [Solidesulfovibrio sp.]MEA5088893.1 SagB/ThcOx family dehydrogenase [Solidesulfovibrio sp.]